MVNLRLLAALVIMVFVLATSFGDAAVNISSNILEIIMKPGQTTSPFIIKDSTGVPQVTMDATGKVEASGGINVGPVTAPCNAANKGMMRYESTGKNMEFCDGSAWKS